MGTPVVLKPQLIGDWRDALNRDSVVQSHLDANGSVNNGVFDQALAAFKNAPATGCASIITQARIQSGFNPLDPAQVGNINSFTKWLEDIIDSNFFTLEYSNNVSIGGVGDWNQYLNQLTAQYVGISAADVGRIQASVRNLIQASYSMPGNPETVQMVSNSLQANGSSISAFFYYTTAQIIYNKGGKHSTSQLSTVFNVFRCKLNFNITQWEAQAEQVMNKKIELVKNWLNSVGGSGLQAMAIGIDLPVNTLPCINPIPGIRDALSKGNVNNYWYSFSWSEFPINIQSLFKTLGWEQETWDSSTSTEPKQETMPWSQLAPKELAAAKRLGFTEVLWNGPSISKAIRSTDKNAYWSQFKWKQMSAQIQGFWSILGWEKNNWNQSEQSPLNRSIPWGKLNQQEQAAASSLGFTSVSWEKA